MKDIKAMKNSTNPASYGSKSGNAGTTLINKEESSNKSPLTQQPFMVELSREKDLFYHCFSLMDLWGDASSLYHPQYIKKLEDSGRKELLLQSAAHQESANKFRRVYFETPGSLWFSLIPLALKEDRICDFFETAVKGQDCREFFKKGFEELLSFYTSLEFLSLIEIFSGLMFTAKDDYFLHWNNIEPHSRFIMESFQKILDLECKDLIKTFVKDLPNNKGITVHLSRGMFLGGRASAGKDGAFYVSTAMPQSISDESLMGTFFQAVHELTHYITDYQAQVKYSYNNFQNRDTKQENTDGYKLHRLLEQEAHAYDYRLFEKHSEKMRIRYIKWASEAGFYG